MEDTRLELVEACLQSRCSSRCANPPNKMFLQLTVKNQEHQKFKHQDALSTSLRKKSKKQFPIYMFYCLFAVTHLSKETFNCQRTYIDKNLCNKNNGSHRRYRPCLTRVNSSVPTLASPMGIKSFNFQRINLCLYYILFSIFINIFYFFNGAPDRGRTDNIQLWSQNQDLNLNFKIAFYIKLF